MTRDNEVRSEIYDILRKDERVVEDDYGTLVFRDDGVDYLILISVVSLKNFTGRPESTDE